MILEKYKNKEFDYIIVGAGLSGLNLAKELSKGQKRILLLEKGRFLNRIGSLISSAAFYDKCALSKSIEGIVIYRVLGVGGSSVVSCGNAVETPSIILEEFDKFGINLREEIELVKKELRVSTKDFPIGRASFRIMEFANKLGYETKLMPKFGIVGECSQCGKCVLGCRNRAKWTALEFLSEIDRGNITLVTRFPVSKILVSNDKAIGVEGGVGAKKRFFGEKIILSAGGIGTPVILQKSGVKAGDGLFVDLFNVTYGFHQTLSQAREVCMSVVCDKFYKSDGFILSSFIDNFVGFCSSVELRHIKKVFHLDRMLGVMTKIKDENTGNVDKNGRIQKFSTQADSKKLEKGSVIAKEILIKCGVNAREIFVTRPRGAHPGGTAGIGRVVNSHLETKVRNLFVCDTSILPCALGVPPMLTLLALSRWFKKAVLED